MNVTHLIASAVLFIAACGPAASGKPDDAPAAPVAVTSPTPAPATPVVTATDLVGRWGDNGDCTKDIVINADGSFHSYTGGAGTWTLQGDVMSMTGSAGTFQVRVQIINQNTLMIANPDGSWGMSQRC